MMAHRLRSALVSGLLIASAAACGSTGDEAPVAGASGAWARPTPAGATNGVVYLTVVTDTDDTLVSASVDPAVAAEATLHATSSSGDSAGHSGHHDGGGGGDVLAMEDIDEFALQAGEPFAFTPGANHIMLTDLTAPLRAGEHFTLSLHLASGREISADVVITENPPE